MNLKKNEPLSRHTYFKLGGPADLFGVARTTSELTSLVRYAITHSLPYLVLGGGSNVLIRDKGFRGLVIKNMTRELRLAGFAGQVTKSAASGGIFLKEVVVQADGGVPTNQLIRFTLDQGLAGLEELLGLPGTVGGGIYNNSHHLDVCLGDHVIKVEALDQAGELISLTPSELKLGYDSSIFHTHPATILSVAFQLKQGDRTALWAKANAAVSRRAATQPLGEPSSGCVFKNISVADSLRLGLPSGLISAGYLIDKAGLKGKEIGGARISSKHANFIVNTGTATTHNVLSLIALVRRTIKEKYGVGLEEEIFILGEI